MVWFPRLTRRAPDLTAFFFFFFVICCNSPPLCIFSPSSPCTYRVWDAVTWPRTPGDDDDDHLLKQKIISLHSYPFSLPIQTIFFAYTFISYREMMVLLFDFLFICSFVLRAWYRIVFSSERNGRRCFWMKKRDQPPTPPTCSVYIECCNIDIEKSWFMDLSLKYN